MAAGTDSTTGQSALSDRTGSSSVTAGSVDTQNMGETSRLTSLASIARNSTLNSATLWSVAMATSTLSASTVRQSNTRGSSGTENEPFSLAIVFILVMVAFIEPGASLSLSANMSCLVSNKWVLIEVFAFRMLMNSVSGDGCQVFWTVRKEVYSGYLVAFKGAITSLSIEGKK